MREIKFRAWDGLTMHYPSIVTVGVNGWNGQYSVSFQPKDSSGYCTTCYFMQFTGLRDKNGREIYEGDVVVCRAIAQYEGNEHLMAIMFYQGAFCLAWPDGGISQSLWPFIVSYTIEVIGNIYENPELLK